MNRMTRSSRDRLRTTQKTRSELYYREALRMAAQAQADTEDDTNYVFGFARGTTPMPRLAARTDSHPRSRRSSWNTGCARCGRRFTPHWVGSRRGLHNWRLPRYNRSDGERRHLLLSLIHI